MADYSSNYQSVEEVESYGKLEGPTIKQFIYKPVVFLGREANTENLDNSNEQCIFIGDSQKISRKHAKISWNFERGEWEIQILSKNKAIINGVTLRNLDNPQVLPPMSAIKIDKFKFYFFPAVLEKSESI
jgi:hypothetical protein